MDFDLNDDQRAMQSSVREFLELRYPPTEVRRLVLEEPRRFTDAQWSAISALDVAGLPIAEEYGGLGLGMVELCVLQEQMGYACVPSPLWSTLAAGLALSHAGSESQRARWLPRLASGVARGAVSRHGIAADADAADVLVISDDAGLRVLERSAARVEAVEALDPTRPLYRVSCEDGEAMPGDARAVENRIAVSLAAESVGVAQKAMEIAVAYAQDRRQFGTPIGAFQAVAHRCAQMLLETEGARSVVLYAAWTLDHSPEQAPVAAAMAKAYASDAGFRVPVSALQVLGGVGFTWEHDLHWWLKRGRANSAAWGGSAAHRTRVAELAGF